MPKYLIDMPERWKPQVCGLCSMDYACHANYDIKTACINRCPLANAKEAVEVTTDHMETYEEDAKVGYQSINGNPVTLYAVSKEANNGKV